MHALADEILKYRRAVRLLAQAAGRTRARRLRWSAPARAGVPRGRTLPDVAPSAA
jgi:hypothetical protein